MVGPASYGLKWPSTVCRLYEVLTGLPPFYCHGDDLQTVERVIRRKIKWSDKYVSGNVRDLIDKLLQVDCNKRFGCLKGGAEDIKRHYYFADVDWAAAAAGGLQPPWAPGPPATDDPWAVAWYRQDEERDSFAPFDPSEGPAVMATHQHLFDDF